MPARPPARNGHRRRTWICRTSGPIVPNCSNVLHTSTRNAVCTGSKACSQTEAATSAKANPAPPDATAPRKPPSHSMASVAGVNRAATTGSSHIEEEHEADGRGAADADRHDGGRALAQRQEFDREHAQAER